MAFETHVLLSMSVKVGFHLPSSIRSALRTSCWSRPCLICISWMYSLCVLAMLCTFSVLVMCGGYLIWAWCCCFWCTNYVQLSYQVHVHVRKSDVSVIPSPLFGLWSWCCLWIWTAGLYSHLWCLFQPCCPQAFFLVSLAYLYILPQGGQTFLVLTFYLLTPFLDPPGYWGIGLS